jgi:hypothetical protein
LSSIENDKSVGEILKVELDELENMKDLELKKLIKLNLNLFSQFYAGNINQLSGWEGIEWEEFIDFGITPKDQKNKD